MVDEAADTERQVIVVGDADAALAALNVLVDVERVDADMRCRAAQNVVVESKWRLRSIHNELDPIGGEVGSLVVTPFSPPLLILCEPKQMREEYRLHARVRVVFNMVEDEAHAIDIAKDWACPGQRGSRRCRAHGQRRTDEAIAAAQPDRMRGGEQS